MREWQRIMPLEDQQIYEKSGHNKTSEFGKTPALLIVDIMWSTIGSKPTDSINEAIEEARTSCGAIGWEAVKHVKVLLDAFRKAGRQVIFIKGDPVYKAFCGGSTKSGTGKEQRKLHSKGFPNEIAPLPEELVIQKTKASAFFATPLTIYLNRSNIDTLVIVGATTSGCLRSSVVDGFSHGYKTFVVEEGCFDRSQFSHNVNLYEINAKYADVITVQDALGYLEKSISK